MIVKWTSDFVGTSGIQVESQDYDGEPRFDRFFLDSAPKTINPDRIAVASYLVFGSFMSGEVRFPYKFSPAVESAMQNLVRPVPANFGPIEYYPKAMPEGSRCLDLYWDEADDWDARRGGNYLFILRADNASGAVRTMTGLRVASNAWMHCLEGAVGLASILPYIAVGVLFAEDLEVDTIRISGMPAGDLNLRNKIVGLLASARLGLTFEEDTGPGGH